MGKVILTTGRPTERQIRACAPFGLTLEPGTGGEGAQRALDAARHVVREARGGCVVLLTGPSGSGKSRCLGAIGGILNDQGQRTVRPGSDVALATRLIDLFGEVEEAGAVLRRLALFGLAEPALAARTVGELSEGQRHRAMLARAFFDAERVRAGWVLIDEFASVLDRVTAFGLAATLTRAAKAAGVRVVCATAHADMVDGLSPGVVVEFGVDGAWRALEAGSGRRAGLEIAIERGEAADMEALLCHHYVAGRPATRVGFLRAVDRARGLLAGVLVVSMPTLNGAWREQAWPGRYTRCDKRAGAGRINRELRCISRVIVEPRYRGLGLATKLVRAYLERPLSVATEAIAAMGATCPFFERAGMRAYRVPMAACEARLGDAVEAAGFEAWMLADCERAGAIIGNPLVARELVRWARARRIVSEDVRALCRVAGARLCVEPRGYAAVFPPELASSRRRKGGRSGREESLRTGSGTDAAGAG